MASYTEDQIITSDPRQLLEIEQAKQEFNSSLAQVMVPRLSLKKIRRKSSFGRLADAPDSDHSAFQRCFAVGLGVVPALFKDNNEYE